MCLSCNVHSAISGGEKEMMFFVVLITHSWGELMPPSRGDKNGQRTAGRAECEDRSCVAKQQDRCGKTGFGLSRKTAH